MGIMMPETCRDKSLIINIRLVASCWFLSLHPTVLKSINAINTLNTYCSCFHTVYEMYYMYMYYTYMYM